MREALTNHHPLCEAEAVLKSCCGEREGDLAKKTARLQSFESPQWAGDQASINRGAGPVGGGVFSIAQREPFLTGIQRGLLGQGLIFA